MSFFHQVFFSGFGSPSGAADELPAEEAEDEPRPDEAEAWARSEAAAGEPRPEVSAERALPLREEPSREVPSSVSGAVFPPLRLLRSRFVFVIVCSVIVILGITCGGIRGGRGNGFRFRFRLAALFNLVIADVFN